MVKGSLNILREFIENGQKKGLPSLNSQLELDKPITVKITGDLKVEEKIILIVEREDGTMEWLYINVGLKFAMLSLVEKIDRMIEKNDVITITHIGMKGRAKEYTIELVEKTK